MKTFSVKNMERKYEGALTLSSGRRSEMEDNTRVAEALHDLRLGAIRGDLEAVKLALAKGITVNQTLKGGWSALMYACSLAHPALVEHLLQLGANPNFHKELFTPLMAACASTLGDEDRLVQCVVLLLQYKADVNIAERHHITALMFAAKEGHAKVVARLLSPNCNCDIDAKDSQGWTALFWAVNGEREKVVEVLVGSGAGVTVTDRRGHTALQLARSKGFERIVDILSKKSTGLIDPLPEFYQSLQPGDKKTKYVFGKRADMMLQAFLDELSGSVINNNGRCGNNFTKLLNNNVELQNNLESFKGHGIISKIAQSVNGCLQNSLVLPNKISLSPTDKQTKSVEISWKNIPYSAVEAREMLGHTVKHLEALYASVSYMRLHMQGHPPAALVEDKFARISEVTALSQKALNCTRLLYDELHFFHQYAKQLEESDQVVPADFVMEQKIDRHRGAVVSSLVIAAAVVVVLFNSRILTLSIFTK